MSPVTPTDRFADMSLGEPAPQTPTAQETPPRPIPRAGSRERALHLQDILSAFHDTVLPSEYEVETVSTLDRPEPSSHLWQETDRTVSGSLERTLLQWGAYNDETYIVLDRLLTTGGRARAFYDKLGRRFRKCYIEYEDDREELEDDPLQSEHRDPTGEPVKDTRHRIEHIATKLRHLAAAINTDRVFRIFRRAGEDDTLEITLEALAWVCRQTEDKFALPENQRQTRRSSSSLTSTNLFDRLVRNPHGEEANELFLLDALESFNDPALGKHQESLNEIAVLLHQNEAPSEYTRRFAGLQRRAAEQALMPPTFTQAFEQPRAFMAEPATHPNLPAEPSNRRGASGRGGPPSSGTPATEPRTNPPPPAESSTRRGRSSQGPAPGSKRSAENNNRGSRKRGSK